MCIRDRDDVDSVVREIEQCAIDIAPHYKDWVELGFALVEMCIRDRWRCTSATRKI